nr:retrovirus-related Pol polyprotein from transposon TNT 1-94 [Tanacetum cinerariifolium]
MTIIGTKWVFRNKLDEKDIVSRNKARLVAQGYNQQEGIDYDEIYALVTRLKSIRILLAYACPLDFKLFQIDVKSAFLNGFINENVYVAQTPGFIDFEKPYHVYKLKKDLYGLKQAPKAWYDRLKAFLIKNEYKIEMVDNTLFTKKKSSNIIIVQIYVDDIIFGSTCQDMCDEFAKIMHDEFKMSMMGELNFFLGLQIKQMEDSIFFNQSKYIKEMLNKFSLEDYKPMKTPMSSDPKLTKDDECESVDNTKYQGMIGLWYPKGTGIETVVYADSDHAVDYVDRKRTSGICTFVGCCLTAWFLKKQTALAISTTEAEYISARKTFMSSNSHTTITYTSMSSYEVIVNGYFGMPMDPLDPYVQLVMEAPPSPDYIPGPEAPSSPDYIPGPEAPPSPDYIPGPKYPEYLPPADDVLPAEEQPLPAAVSPTAESPGYITDSKPEMEPEEEDGDDEKSEGDSIEYSTSRGDDDADDDGDDLSEDDADDDDEEESSDSEKEEDEHLAPTVPAPALHSSIPAFEDSDETEPFEEGKTAATPPPFGYRVAAKISVQPHRLMPFRSDESTPKVDMPLRKRARFTTSTGGYKVGESSVAAARQIRPALTVADSRRAEDRLIGRLRRERRYFRTLSTTYAQENSYIRAVSQEVAYTMPWKTLKQMMTAKYYPRGKVKKLEVKLWNLKVKGTDITSYTLCFKELTLLCKRMFPEESDEIERYVSGLPEMIRGNVMSYEPKSMQKAIEFANDQMDQKLLGISDRQANNKRKFDNTSMNQQNQQPFKRNNNVARAYDAGSKPYGGTKPLSRAANTNNNNNNNYNNNNRRATTAYQGGNQNQAGNGNVVARAYGLGTAGGNPDANVVTGTFLLNNHCASILFDTGADKSFVSAAFSSLININPSTLDYSYDVELADGQIIKVNTIIRGCTLNFLNRPFNIDLMPMPTELGSFDVIIGMDWLKKYHAVIVCDEKIVRVPFGNETLIIRCDGSNNGNQLNIISCTKTRNYLLKGYPVFLANITTKMIKDKSEEKRLEDVPIVRDFSHL